RQVINAVNFESTILYSGRKKPMTRISRGQPVTSGEGGVTVEAFGNKDDLFYRFIGKNLSSPKYEQNVHELVTRFESRADTSLPLESGFCTENGLVHDPISAEDNETVTMFAALSSHPDVLIRLDTAVVDEPEETLLARHAKNDIAAEFAKNITTLRQGARDLNGLAGEEVLLRVKEANGTTVHSFMWASPGKGADLLAPSITLEMQTGKARPGNTVNSSLSDEAARQLWQDISSSLKIRPVGPAPQKRPAPVPLGELVPTGQPCPHTGYWQCGVTGRASGAQREFIRHGEVMPHVLLHEVPSLWQKLTGRAPLRRAATVWKLVAYDTADGTDKSGTDIT
ncbi:MAG: T6SS immunity protein Tli4 family protein, partial [Gammaproteobacteria bacterium]